MKFDLVTIILIGVMFLLGGCASQMGVVKQIPETVKEGAKLYVEVRPQVIEARAQFAENWDDVPEKVKPILVKIDTEILPVLDDFGQKLVLAADILDGVQKMRDSGVSLRNVNWDQALSTVLKAAGTVAQLKMQGAF